MKFANRLKFTVSATSAATLTPSAAPLGFRTLAQAIAAGELAVGQSGVPFAIDDGAGNWEESYFTLTSSTLLTRESIHASSNNGAAATFTGTPTVAHTPFAAHLDAGLIDQNDVGFDIVLCAGQSNMAGNPASDPLIDVNDSRVFQWSTPLGDATRHQILSSTEPLYMLNGPVTGHVGPATWFAKAYLSTIPPNRKVLLVPCAAGSTALVNSYWQPGGPGGVNGGYEVSISEANLAITAAQARYPNSRFVGVIWAQGEGDAIAAIPQWQYAMNLKALIAGFRSRITGAANSWFIISSMTPSARTTTYGPAKFDPIDLAHKQVVAEVSRAAFIPPVSGMDNNSEHYSAAGIRIMGSRMGVAVPTAKLSVGADTTAPVIVAASVADNARTTVVLTLSEQLNSATPPTSAFAIAGHTITNAVVSPSAFVSGGITGNTITLTVGEAFVYGEAARNVVYTQPGTSPVADQSGNLLAGATVAITNNIAASASAPTLQSAVIGSASPSTIVLTFSAALAAITPPAADFTITGTANTVSSVAVSGSTVTLTMGTAYVAGNTANVTYAPSGTNDLQDTATTPNKVAGFGPTAVTNNVGASAQTISVNTPATQTVGTAFTVSGTYANGTPTALDYRLSDDAAGAWTQVATATISGGTYSFSLTPASTSAGRTISVRDRTTLVSGTSGTYAVNASGGTTYATMSATDKDASITLSNGNLTATGTVSGFRSARANVSKSAGKWFWEVLVNNLGGSNVMVGFGGSGTPLNNFVGNDTTGLSTGYYGSSGNIYDHNANNGGTRATFTAGDVIGIALDLDAKTALFYKNGVAQTPAYSLTGEEKTVPMFPMVTTNANGAAMTLNFGATAFAYSLPTGFTGLTA